MQKELEIKLKNEELTAEQIEEMEKQIPEWKRGALTVSDVQVEEERKGLIKKLKSSVKSKINQTDTAKQFYQSEEYKRLESIKNEYKEFKSNFVE